MRNLFVATLLAAMTVSPLAFAHIELQSPTARFVQDSNGLKTGPCGTGTPTGVVTPLVAGQTLTVRWKESVSHSGHYRIGLAAHESDFVEPTSLTVPTTLPPWDLADGIPDKTGTQTYAVDVHVPTTPCSKCVLQLLQVMGAGADGTNSGPFSGVYHACADVTISAGSADASVAPDAASSIDLKLAGDAPADEPKAVPDTATGSEGGTTGNLGTGGTGAGGSSASGNGGALSTGGASTAGRGGAPSGGSTSTSNMTGGATGTGGSSATAGAMNPGAGGSAGSGGSVASGGSSGHGGSTSATSGAASGCQMGPRSGATWPAAALIAALLFVWRWRRTRFGRPTNGAMRSPSWTSSSCDTVAIPIKPRRASIQRIARFR